LKSQGHSGQVPFSDGEGKFMASSVVGDLDFIEELRLRRWAREHYVPESKRQPSWHPIVHEEMSKKDLESGEGDIARPTYARPRR
jgi:hypothetical protein